MKIKARFGVGLFAAVALVVHANAASFDGEWVATGQGQSFTGKAGSCPGVQVHFAVKGNSFSSTIGTADFTYQFRGTIAPDGSFDTKSPGGTAHINGKFDGDNVTVQFSNTRCPAPRTATGKRVG